MVCLTSRSSAAATGTLPLTGRAALAKRIVDWWGADVCAQVPGFYVAERDGRRWWTLAGAAGLLIPVRNLDGHIVALKVRADDPGDGPKYTTISSAKHGGPSPGAQVHMPLYSGQRGNTVRLTEGELKSRCGHDPEWYAHHLHSWCGSVAQGPASLAGPAVCSGSCSPLMRIGARIRHVAQALGQAVAALVGAGYTVAVESWDPALGQRHRRCACGWPCPHRPVRRAVAASGAHLPRKVGQGAVTYTCGGAVMASIDVQRINDGWRVEVGEVTLDATHPRCDQGVIHAVLTVSNHAAIHYRDTVNLTSERARTQLLKKLAEKGVALPEEPLIALDQACRTPPTPPPQDPGYGGSDAGRAATDVMASLRKRFRVDAEGVWYTPPRDKEGNPAGCVGLCSAPYRGRHARRGQQ